eukprot:COSAG01_NODE_6051_length_3879_cov_1.779365_1_plen_118_part_10
MAALVELGADVNQATRGDDGGLTPLHIAALERHRDIALMLVQAGADVYCRTKTGLTPLHFAAKHGAAVDLLTLLVNAGLEEREHAAIFAAVNQPLPSVMLWAAQARLAFAKGGHQRLH